MHRPSESQLVTITLVAIALVLSLGIIAAVSAGQWHCTVALAKCLLAVVCLLATERLLRLSDPDRTLVFCLIAALLSRWPTVNRAKDRSDDTDRDAE